MKNRKGFTLVELMGIIIIISIILLISIPPIVNNIKDGKDKLYKAQLENVKLALENWAGDNKDKLPTADKESITITVTQLKQEGYLDIDTGVKKDVCIPNDTTLTITRVNESYKYEVNEGSGQLSCSDKVELGAPIIYLNGDGLVYVEVNSNWIDPGAIAETFEGVDISSRITVTVKPIGNVKGSTTNVDTSEEGNQYEITYIIEDNGYTSVVKRIVIVRDTTPPELTIPDDVTITTENTIFDIMKGVTATDNSGKSVTITVTGTVSLGTTGTYEITYRACDQAKPEPNCTEKKRRVTIVDTTKPNAEAYVVGSPFNARGWANQDFEIHVGTTDEGGTAVAGFRYCLSTYRKCEPNIDVGDVRGNITVSTESAENYFCYYSYDHAGNSSATKCIGPYKLDKTDPEVSLTIDGTMGKNNWYVSDVKVKIHTSDPYDAENMPLSGVYQYGIRPNNGSQTGTNSSDRTADYNMKVEVVQRTDTEGITYYGYVKDAADNVSYVTKWFKLDQTDPVCTISSSGTKGDNNWYVGNVDMTISRSDNLSGVSAYGMKPTNGSQSSNNSSDSSRSYNSRSSMTQTKDTSGVTYYGWIEDYAGNTNTCSKSIKKDATDPSCSLSQSGTKGDNNWFISNVSISISTSDNFDVKGRGIASSSSHTYSSSSDSGAKKTHSSDTTGITYYGYVKDDAGNTSSCSTSFKRDVTDSTCSISASGTEGTNSSGSKTGWYVSNISMSLSTNDSTSRVSRYGMQRNSSSTNYNSTSSITQSENTTGVTYYGFVKDNAGNTGSCNKSVKLDKNKPTCSVSVDGDRNDSGWFTGDVTVKGKCSDTGESNCTGDVSVKATSGQPSPGTVWDNAGNSTSCGSSPVEIKVDTNPPSCTTWVEGGIRGNNGWYRSSVTIYGRCSDPEGNCTTDTVSRSVGETCGENISPGRVCDKSGHCTQCGSEYVQVDWSAPYAASGADNGPLNPPYNNLYYQTAFLVRDNCTNPSDIEVKYNYCYNNKSGRLCSSNASWTSGEYIKGYLIEYDDFRQITYGYASPNSGSYRFSAEDEAGNRAAPVLSGSFSY